MALQLELDVSRGETAAVFVSGELDAFAAPRLEGEVQRLVAGGIVDISLDLAGLEFVDSHGLGTIASLRDGVRALGGDLAVLHLPRQARRVASLLGLAFSPAPAAVENAALAG